MPELNAQLIGDGTPNVPLNDLASVFNNAMNYRQHQMAMEANQEGLRQKQVLNEAYRAAIDPATGNVDPVRLQAHLAQNMGGAQIPGVMKANLDNRKIGVDIADKQADTQKTIQETLYSGLKLVDNTLGALVADPQVDERRVYGEMGRLVNAGAFNAQAQHAGTTPDVYAKNLLSTMPVGNPQALKSWLVQQGLRVADATKRAEMSLPKYDEQDRGGVINQGTIDQFTGQRTDGANITKTVSPDAALNSQTQIRGQDLTDKRVRDSSNFSVGTAGLSEEQNAALGKAINEGRLDPNKVNSRTAGLLADLAIRNPATDFNKLGADSALMRNAGFQQKAITASTLPEVMNNMVNAGKKVNYSDAKIVGTMQQWYKGQVNDPDLADYMTQRNDALMSIAATMRGVGMTDQAHKVEIEAASPTMSPNALDGWLRGQTRSLEPRLRNNARIMHTASPDIMPAPPAAASGGTAVPVVAPGVVPSPGATRPGATARPSLDSFYR